MKPSTARAHTRVPAPLVLCLALVTAAGSLWQADPATDAASAPAPEPLASYVDPARGERVALGRAEYQDYLLELYGLGELEGLVYRRLLESEAQRLGIAGDLAAAQSRAREQWQEFVEVRFGGDEGEAAKELAERGFSVERYIGRLATAAYQGALEDSITIATREPSEEKLLERFESQYGKGGVRVTVRHIFQSRARMQQDLIRAGRAPQELTPKVLDLEIEARLRGLRDELEAGADFAALAQRASHDLASQSAGGVIAGYNYDRFGDALADAVRASEPGALFGPIAGPSGWHLGRVDERTVTSLDEVRSNLAAELAAEPANPLERAALRQRLVTAAAITKGPN
ncbi:MAG: hypothetical protein GC161_14410 [Planctomycetaceae bacterium]|nr:hypothetical protein [Planctomycetaceae bacterium]